MKRSNRFERFLIAASVCAILLGFGSYFIGKPGNSLLANRTAHATAAPEVETREGLRRVSPHGVVAPSTAATSNMETVEYYNPNTGVRSTYELEVDRDSEGHVERINFPNEGWIEIDGDTTKNADGSETYTNEHGAEYTIRRSEGDETGDDSKDSE